MKLNQVTWYSKLAALILFILLPFAGFYLGMKYQEALSPPSSTSYLINPGAPNSSSSATKNATQTINKDGVTISITNKDGTLTYSGTVEFPTPCYKLNVDSIVAESYPEQVQIKLTTEPQNRGEFCAAVLTKKTFSGTVKVSASAKVYIYLNDQKIY